MADPVAVLINTYHELNASAVEELDEEPSPLEFMRHVARNRPFIVKKAAADWDAVQKWNASYLRNAMDDLTVNVAVTPLGNADAVVERDDGMHLFVEPHEQLEPFSRFLDYVQLDTESARDGRTSNVKYAQTQNDNLHSEYTTLLKDVPKDIDFARLALDRPADAVNLWIGNDRSTTALHKDHYENVYVQIRGQKHFILMPPIEMPCVNEQPLMQAQYKPMESSNRDMNPELTVQISENEERLPVATWDPDEPEKRATQYSHLSKPYRVTLEEGDMLYLPAMWYHKVSQTSRDEGFACAVNYWYDMDFDGSFWACHDFMRNVVREKAAIVRYPELGTGNDV